MAKSKKKKNEEVVQREKRKFSFNLKSLSALIKPYSRIGKAVDLKFRGERK